jgi:hypothetical protein
MRTPNMKTRWLHVSAALSALILVPIGAVLARPMPCITEDRGCDKDVLCAFKVDLAEKILLYKTNLASSPSINGAKNRARQRVPASNTLYNAALTEANRENRGASAEDIAVEAYKKFALKLRAKLNMEASRYKDCTSLQVQPNDDLRGTWIGMGTAQSDCNVYGTIGTPENPEHVTLDTLLDQSGGCREFYDSDRKHEGIHQGFCRGRQKAENPLPPLRSLGDYIDEDIEAYRESMQQAGNDLQRLQIQCSADPDLDEYRSRADELLNELKQYGVKVAGRQ